MAVNGRKISSFNQLGNLSGEEFLMVAYKGKSYKIPTQLLIGNIISSITQTKNSEDGAANVVTMNLSDGSSQQFTIYNGLKGSKGEKGETGDKGERGDSGIALYNTTADDIKSLIVNSLDGANFTDEELTQRILSAAMGMVLNKQVSELKEVYFETQEDFDKAEAEGKIYDDTKYFINPTGRFVIGGPHGDSGLTGRKIIVDTYGGYARHGGGAFSGKDPTKVDRSASYAARYAAKNIVAAGLADKCEIQLSYAIGVARPTSIQVETFGTGKLSDEKLFEIVRENFDLRPAGIIKMLDLRRLIYKQTASYGHFGRTDVELPWEKTDLSEKLAAYLEK